MHLVVNLGMKPTMKMHMQLRMNVSTHTKEI